MFTVEELELLERIVYNTPIQGTLQTLPDVLHKLSVIQMKIKMELERLNLLPEPDSIKVE